MKTHFATNTAATAFAAALSQYQFSSPVGNVFFVDSARGTDGDGYGRSPDAPFASIAYAVGKCTADNNDVICVVPGHVETITAAGGVTVNVAGVTILGVGHGRQRGRINYTTAAGASFDVTAARVRVENLTFTPLGVDNVTAAVNVQAADCQIVNCEFDLANATSQAALGVLSNASADRMLIDRCFFHGTTDAGCAAAISMVGGNEITIRNNVIMGSFHASNGVILNSTTDCLNLTIDNNTIVNRTASSTKVVVLTATSTGAITNNRVGILSGTAPFTAAAADVVGGNYYKAAAGVAAGTLI